jgi:hypothetical protein
MNRLCSKLLRNNAYEIANKYKDIKDIISNVIQNVDIIEYIERRFDYLDLTTNKARYNDALHEIKLLLKSNTK